MKGGRRSFVLRQNHMEENRIVSDTPVAPLPNPGEGGPVYDDEAQLPSVPLPNPGEGGPVYDDGAQIPVIPLPNPGEGGPVYDDSTPTPIITYPNPGSAIQPLPTTPTFSYAAIRFLNAAYGYSGFRAFIGNRRAASLLSFSAVSAYSRVSSGYQTVTITGTDGYIYLQKTLPFESGGRFTIAIINRPGGLDLLKITDNCCTYPTRTAHFRVGNLARNSGALDVLLPDGRTVFTDVRFKEVTAFKRISSGAYEFLFAETNQLPAPAYSDIETLDSAFIGANPLPDTAASVYLNVSRGRAYTVYLLQNGQSYNAVSPLIVADSIR